MNVKKSTRTRLLVPIFILALVAAACTSTDSVVENNDAISIISVDEEGTTSIDSNQLDAALETISNAELSQAEIDGLIFMREEEKLAKDVYLFLGDLWDSQVFLNIAKSEETHTEAVRTLLDRYGIEDPASSAEMGEFTNPDLQALYDQLTAQGSQSLGDALIVGAVIEEIDILDLDEYIAQTDNQDIILVYENLLKGSRNHLRAFVKNIANQTGEVYTPQYMTQEEYDDIVGTSIESGRQTNGRRGQP